MKSHKLNPFIALAFVSQSAFAVDGTTTGAAADANFDWNAATTAPWTDGIVADGAGSTANFTAELTGNRTVTIRTASKTIGNITFTDGSTSSNDLNIAAAAGFGLTLDNGASSPILSVTQTGNRRLTISAPVSGSNGFTKQGPGLLFLSNTTANVFAGEIKLDGGRLQLSSDANLGDLNNDLSVISDSGFFYNANFTLNANRSINLGANLSFEGFAGNNRKMQVDGVISGTGGIVLRGDTSLAFPNNTNSFTGLITFDGGGLQLANDSNLGNADNDLSVISDSRIFFNSPGLVLNANRSINLAAKLTINGFLGNNRDLRVDGIISGAGDLALTDATTNLVLAGANDFTGNVSIAAGGQTSGVSNHTFIQVGTGPTDNVSTLGNATNPVTLGGFGGAAEGVAASDGSSYLIFRRDDYAFAGPISGPGVVWIGPADAQHANGSTIELTGNNSYTGHTRIEQGALKVSSSYDGGTMTGALAPANLRFNNQAVLLIAGDLDTSNPNADFTRAIGTADGQVQWTNGGGFAAFGADRIVNLGGAGATVTWNPDFGNNPLNGLFLSHPDANAKLIFNNPIDLGPTAGNRIFRVHDGSAPVDAEISAAISGSAGVGIQKNDLGTLVLSGINTYDGPTQVNEGNLVITNAVSINASTRLDPRTGGTLDLSAIAPYSIGSGRTLTGTGTVLGAVTVTGTLSPGVIAESPAANTPGTLTTDALSLNILTTVEFDLNTQTLAADKITANGNVQLGSAIPAVNDVAPISTPVPPGTKIVLIDYTGHTLTGTFFGLPDDSTITVAGTPVVINYDDTSDGINAGNFVTLTVPSDPYQAWSTEKSLVAPDAGKFDDKDADGLENILEWVLNTNPLASDQASARPTLTKTGDSLSFTFTRRDDTLGEVDLTVQHGNDFIGWTDLPVPATTSGAFANTDNGATDTVTATISVIGETKHFVRLQAE